MGKKFHGSHGLTSILLAAVLAFSSVELPAYAAGAEMPQNTAQICDALGQAGADIAAQVTGKEETQAAARVQTTAGEDEAGDAPVEAGEGDPQGPHMVYTHNGEPETMTDPQEEPDGGTTHISWGEYTFIWGYNIDVGLTSVRISWTFSDAPHHYLVHLYKESTGELLTTYKVYESVCDMNYKYEPNTSYYFWAQLCNEDESLKSRMPDNPPGFTTPQARKIIYELNGGTNNENNPEYVAIPTNGGESKQLLYAPTKQGSFFEGWYLDAAFTQKVERNILVLTGDTTVYAKWSSTVPADAVWYIYFNGNDEDGGNTPKQTIPFSQTSVKLNKNGYTKKGYVFACWNTKPDGSGKSYADEETVGQLASGSGETVTLYAIWTEAGKGIHYELNGGINNEANPPYFTSTLTEFDLKDPFRSGYVFEGWYTDPAFAEGTRVTRLTKAQHDGITVYAKWRACTYTVVYNKNDDSAAGSMENSLMTYEGKGKLTANAYTRTEYVFCGWKLTADGKGEAIPDQADQSVLESVLTSIEDGMTVTLYAVWGKMGTYTITYELNGGTNHPENPGTFEAGSSLQLKDPTREGYTFGGWFKDAAFTDRVKTLAGIAENITLYAKWEKSGNPPAPEDKDDNLYEPGERQSFSSIEAKIGKLKGKVYDGNDYMPVVKVTAVVDNRKVVLTEVADYRVSYEDNVDAGIGKVIVRGNGAYSGEISEQFTIKKRPVGKLKVVVGNMGLNSQEEPPIYVYDGARLLKEGEDYTLSGMEGITASAGRKTVKLTAIGNYTGERNVNVTVSPTDKILREENVTIQGAIPYNGKVQKPTVTVRYGTEELEKKFYTVKYINNRDAGTAYVLVTGRKEYAGSVLKSFKITTVTKEFKLKQKPADTTFTGKVQKPKTAVTVDGKTLRAGKDYVIFYRNNFHASRVSGQATVIIMGRGSYADIPVGTFSYTVQPQEIAKAVVKGSNDQLTVTYAGRKLKEEKDYRVTGSRESDGKMEVTIEGLGDFKGSVVKKVKMG